MPHKRQRHIWQQLKKRLSFFRVVSIQGARQTGKSFLAREILGEHLKASVYLTFDKEGIKDRATRTPDTFVQSYEGHRPVVIDEAQKVPAITP